MDNIYHALRVAFLCGDERVPWHMVCHAIRQGLDLDCKTYILQEKDFVEFPILRELVDRLSHCILNINEVDKFLNEGPREAIVPLIERHKIRLKLY